MLFKIFFSLSRTSLFARPLRGVLVLFLGLIFFAAGCGKEEGKVSKEGKPVAVATTAMVGDLITQLAGDTIEVRTIMGEGIDPHTYQPTRRDLAWFQEADIIFYHGLNLEGSLQKPLENLARQGKEVIALAEVVFEQKRYPVLEESPGVVDPHLWMDVAAWKAVSEVAAEALKQFLPSAEKTLAQQKKKWDQQLSYLDNYIRQTLETIPAENRLLITAHDAFGYLESAYGIEVHGIQGISTESEAGLRDIENLVTLLVTKKIPAVFVESSVSDKNIRALKEGTVARGWNLQTGGTLYSDSMGAPGTWEGTYPGMMEHNIRTITEALGGTTPEKDFRMFIAHQGAAVTYSEFQ